MGFGLNDRDILCLMKLEDMAEKMPDEVRLSHDPELLGKLLGNYWKSKEVLASGQHMPIKALAGNSFMLVMLHNWQNDLVAEHFAWVRTLPEDVVTRARENHWNALTAIDQENSIFEQPEMWDLRQIYDKYQIPGLTHALAVWFCSPFMEAQTRHVIASVINSR